MNQTNVNKETVGWRCWYDNGDIFKGSTFEDWKNLPKEFCLVKMIYYADGTKQIQTMDWWYEVLHEKGVIRATCHDNDKAEIEALHPDAVFVEGFWTTDEWFNDRMNLAMRSSYGE